MCDRCLRIAKMKEDYNKMKKQTNESLLDELIRESGYNNEYDNWKTVQMLREEVLKRMR